MIEILFIAALIFGLFVLFYRQAVDEFNILQIEGSQLADLPKLLSERTPVVLRGIGDPKLFTPETLGANPRLPQFPLNNQWKLGAYLEEKSRPLQMRMPIASSELLAQESGLQVWAEHNWFPKLLTTGFLEFLYTLRTEAHVGEQGLRKTTAVPTLLYPTSGALEVTLLTEHQSAFLPKSWRGRFPETFTIQDTPLVGEIKYITIKLRPGNALCIPSHWFVSLRVADTDKDKPVLWSWMEMHHPISRLANYLENQERSHL
jgi:hypothetical protein